MLGVWAEIPGVEFPPDSGAGKPGVFFYPSSVDPSTRTRSFARSGHFDHAAHRSNHHVLTEHRVLRVLFDKSKRATSVAYLPRTSRSLAAAKTVRAKKEVILAANTLHTPQILQASGLGPRRLLAAAGIPLIHHLPGVGQNFQDHPFIVGAHFAFSSFPYHPDPSDLYTNQTFIDLARRQFDRDRTGPLSVAVGASAVFLSFPVIAPDAHAAIAARFAAQHPAAHLPPDSDPAVIAGYAAQQSAQAAMMRSRGSAIFNLLSHGGPTEGAIELMHPTSRGTVNIDPADPFFAEPHVDYRALTNPADADILVEFTRFTRRVFTTTTITELGPVEVYPGADIVEPEDIVQWLRERMIPSSYHAIGTCAMMPQRLGGVVDQKLRVYGVKGLSIVDASVIPDQPGAYTQQTVYAIAEKVSLWCCDEWFRGLVPRANIVFFLGGRSHQGSGVEGCIS